jgi:hypothetical protein
MTKSQAREALGNALAMMKADGIKTPETIEQFEKFRRLNKK